MRAIVCPVGITKSIGLPANGYTYSTHEFPDGQEGRTRFVCRIFLDRELLAELSQSICYGANIVDVSEDYI